MAAALVEMWQNKSAQEAHDILAKPDVEVTNKSDKDEVLPIVVRLNETIKQKLGEHEQCEAALKQLARAMASRNLKSIDGALAIAKQAGVAPGADRRPQQRHRFASLQQ